IYGFALSFFQWELISPAPPRFIGWGNYAEALGSNYFWMALWATFRFVIMSVPLTVAAALILAVALRAAPPRRQGFYRAAYFLPVILSISVVGILWRWFYNPEFGLF